MKRKNNLTFYPFPARFLVLLALTGFLAGCAATALDQANEEEINSPVGGMLRLAAQMQDSGDDQGAMEFLAQAVHRAPDSVLAHQRLAALLEKHNDNEDAVGQYAALVALKPDTIEFHRDYGRSLIKAGKVEAAKDQYEAALRIDPNDAKSHNGLGIALDLGGDHESAEQQYRAVLESTPDDQVALNNLGHSYVLAKKYPEAIALLEPHAQQPGIPPTLRDNLAAAYAMNGKDIDAKRMLKADRTPTEAKKKLAHYKDMRAKSAAPMVYANLGSFSTPDMAKARIDDVRKRFADDVGQLSLEVAPRVDTEGGTPDFYAQATGFKDRPSADAFCQKLSEGGAFCKAHEG